MSSDQYGNRYTANYEQLSACKAGITSIEINQLTKSIYGKSEFDNAFQACKGTVRNVLFPENSQLTTIQPYAFYQCTALQSIDFSPCTKLTIIEKYSFAYCSQLSNIIFNEGLLTIGGYCFLSTKLKSVEFPSTIQTISEYSFTNIPSLKSVTYAPNCQLTQLIACVFEGAQFDVLHIPPKLSSFDPIAVWNVKTIKSIVIDGGKSDYFVLQENILYDKDLKKLIICPKAESSSLSFNIPNSVIELGQYSFPCCSFQSFEIPTQITKIGGSSFRSSSLTSITIPENVQSIGTYCFHNCRSLSEIEFKTTKMTMFSSYLFTLCNFETFYVPDGIKTIGTDCFDQNKKLINVTLPTTVTNIYGGAFSHCHENLSISFRGEGAFFFDEQNLFLNNEQTKIVSYFGNQQNHKITIPVNVKEIASNAFSSKTNIAEIIIPQNSNLQTIGENAFEYCSNLVSFTGNLWNLQEIRKEAFIECTALTQFTFGSSLLTIKDQAFDGCSSLKSLDFSLPCSVSCNSLKRNQRSRYQKDTRNITIGFAAFSQCVALESITFGNTFLTISQQSFQYCNSLKKISFPQNLDNIGTSAFISSGLEEVEFHDSSHYAVINDYAFYCANHLRSVIFSSYVTELGRYAFSETNLTDIVLKQSINSIGDSCFANMPNLISFTIPPQSTLNWIGYGVFHGCNKFTKITSDPGNKFIVENSALFNQDRTDLVVLPPCSNVRFFYLPDTVKKITQSSFYGCQYLKTVLIPEKSLTEIENSAFENCRKLERINLPSTITSIGNDAFKGCKNLKCGSVIDINNSTILKTLFNEAQFPQSSLKECIAIMTCKKSYYSITARNQLVLLLFLI